MGYRPFAAAGLWGAGAPRRCGSGWVQIGAREVRPKSPELLTAVEAIAAIEGGELSCEALIGACFDRIEAREADIRAWVVHDRSRALKAARERDAGAIRLPLMGIPLAMKDIIDTADYPTSYGSAIYAAHRPRVNASCVSILESQGAIVAGKTVSTEFAYFSPGPTANPRNRLHTPGGSSSGSAAAVADYMVPIGFGSQTAGSLIRPAAYCGVIGFKPSYGRIALTGVKAFAPSLDTLGWMARDFDDVELVRASLLGKGFRKLAAVDGRIRVGFCPTPEWEMASAETQVALCRAADMLKRHAEVAETGLSDAGLAQVQKTIMAFEAARALWHEYHHHKELLSRPLCDLIEAGLTTSYEDYLAAHRRARLASAEVEQLFSDYDVLMAPSAPGEAPVGLHNTGDPIFSRAWTLLGLPCITFPLPRDKRKMPIGIQLIGALDGDRKLLEVAKSVAKWIET